MKTWVIKSVLARPVGWLLYHANSRPPVASRTEFYALKVRLCRLFGWWERAELQHIVKKCWECEGRGWYQRPNGIGKSCNWCKATGIYRQFWVRLERYNVGGYIFHEPNLRYDAKPEWFSTEIEGLIEHERPKWNLYSECWLWLALLFDRQLFWRDFQGVKRKGWLPMILLQRCYWNSRNWKQTQVGQRICKRFGIDDGIPF